MLALGTAGLLVTLNNGALLSAPCQPSLIHTDNPLPSLVLFLSPSLPWPISPFFSYLLFLNYSILLTPLSYKFKGKEEERVERPWGEGDQGLNFETGSRHVVTLPPSIRVSRHLSTQNWPLFGFSLRCLFWELFVLFFFLFLLWWRCLLCCW